MNTEKKSSKADLERKRPGFFVVGLIVSCGLSLVAFEWRTPIDEFSKAAELAETIEWEEAETIIIKVPEPLKQQQCQKTQGAPQSSKHTFTFVVSNNDDLDPDLSDLDELDFEDEETGETNVKYVAPPTILTDAEFMPEFPGGETERVKFMSRNIRFPFELSGTDIEGKVYVQFVIWTDGSIRDIEILRSGHPALTREVLGMITKMPNWTPGMQNGEKVPVRFIMPVNFSRG